MIVDVHSHATLENIKEYKKENFEVIINGLNPKSNLESFKLSQKNSFAYCANGFHPTVLKDFSEDEIDKETIKIKKRKDKLIAIGEVGLDYKYSNLSSEKKHQQKIFKKFIELADELKKPIIVHSRLAEKDVIEILKFFKGKVVMHSYTGDLNLINNLSENYYFSINPLIFREANMKLLVEKISLSQLLVETDFPYVAKTPEKLKEVISEIAKIKKVSEKEVEKNCYLNFKKCFDQ